MSFIQKLLRHGKSSWVYSMVSIFNVSIGLLVTALIWSRYSASRESDILLLAISLMGILSQLSSMAVEQVLYFYADERAKNAEEGSQFFKLTFTWALISGLGFVVLFLVISRFFVGWVATGFSQESQNLVHQLMLCFTPQLILSPCLHVIRAKWSVEERFGRAYLLSSLNSCILLACLIVMLVLGISDLVNFGKMVLGGYSLFLILFVYLSRFAIVRPTLSSWHRIKFLFRQSMAIKWAHAVHSFLVQALINSLLSQLPTGSISVFQYAKKLADGVFAITAGPQVMIYHSRCAQIMSQKTFSKLRHSAAHFLKTFLSLFIFMALLVFILTPPVLSFIAQQFTPEVIGSIRGAYTFIVLWYFLIGIETLAVGIVLSVGHSLALLSINLFFITLLYTWSRLHSIGTVNELILTVVVLQLLSFALFSGTAARIIKRRSEGAR